VGLDEALGRIRRMNCKLAVKRIADQLREFARKAGRKKAVVGLSGGVDSSAVAFIAARAFGRKNVIAAVLPSAATGGGDAGDAREVAERLGVQLVEFNIAPIVRAFAGLNAGGARLMTKTDFGNIAARVRMACLYNLAARSNGLVIGTSDKSEILLGYFTKYGDGGADVLPLGGLFKTQVKELARMLGVPKKIIQKPPSPNLWLGQTAEEELGASYEELDAVLWALEKKWGAGKIEKRLGVKKWLVERVERLNRESGHKRKMPPVLNAFK